MKTLTPTDYDVLRENAQVIEADAFGDKVLQLTNGDYLKLFRIKHYVSSAWVRPYCKRFVCNAQRLVSLGFLTVTIKQRLAIPHLGRTAVAYRPLPGQTLRSVLSHTNPAQGAMLVHQLGELIGLLHQQGVFFRSLHLGNLILTPDNQLGLIDISDLHIRPRPLFRFERRRNFHHLTRCNSDRKALSRWHDDLIAGYTKQTGYTTKQVYSLLELMPSK